MLSENELFQNKLIKSKIEENNKQIEQLLSPNTFILNNQVSALLSENKILQNKCHHRFTNGYCDFCGKEKTSND